MLVKLTKIGNSMGIRLPKSVIKECGFQSDINLSIEQKKVVLSAVNQERMGWNEKIKENGGSTLKTQEEWVW
ncbi:MAG: AbrB/MazE/SpoVT family DNA-binding domain-containing protein [Alphaproteobacteria bacterium]|nr:AbrB/MazE/SpoVT family DNA-binding domain-containing protein [Alphaproteobacteria bacterium]MBQ3117158.1 AbrB/MazE/SpoVT family DNA-binding domain-containing protein [Alphaproteobacteria bacterium]MBQ6854683.1 AbrB/MazE/SpoVT family DNA-binding domain-containing protein [Alphaproteobacteria bacterium]